MPKSARRQNCSHSPSFKPAFCTCEIARTLTYFPQIFMTLGEAISRSVAGLSATEFVQWLFVFVWCVEQQTCKVFGFSRPIQPLDFAANQS